MSELIYIIGIIIVFIFAILLNMSICSCVWISIQRGKKLELLGTMDNYKYMQLIRKLLILSCIFLFIESIGFLVHYSCYNTRNGTYNQIFDTVNVYIIENKGIYISDLIVYFGFLSFLLCSVGAYYIALHRFLLTNQQSNSSHSTPTNLLIVCIICYIIISLTCMTFSVINLFVTLNSKLYYVLLICFDMQLILSSIPVFKSLKQVIAISRDSAKSVRWSVTSVSPSKLYYKMSVKAVRMGMENIILNVLLLADIACDLYQIIIIETNPYATDYKHDNGIPSNFQAFHLIVIYFIQLFIMLFTVDYSWINRKYVTIKNNRTANKNKNKNNKSPSVNSGIASAKQVSPRRYTHSRDNFSDFDYNNTVLKRGISPTLPPKISTKKPEIIKLKAASSMTPYMSPHTPQRNIDTPVSSPGNISDTMENMGELEFLTMNDRVKLRSASFSSTVHNKKKLNKEILSKTTSLDDSNVAKISQRNDSKSVFSLIPKAAKRMSRSFVESVISVDKIWDENECSGNGKNRYSRYNKSKKVQRANSNNESSNKSKKSATNSRRYSVPNNVLKKKKKKKKSKRTRKSLSIKVISTNTDTNNINNSKQMQYMSSPSMPASPISQLESEDDFVYRPTMINMLALASTRSSNSPEPPLQSQRAQVPTYSKRSSLNLPYKNTKFAHRLPSESGNSMDSNSTNTSFSAAPKTYSQRNYNTNTNDENENTSNKNKRKLFNYSHKIHLTDRASDSFSVTDSNATNTTNNTCTQIMGIEYGKIASQTVSRRGSNASQFSELSEIPETKSDIFAIAKYVDEIPPLPQLRIDIGGTEMKMDPIEESKQMTPVKTAKKPVLSLKTASRNSNVSIEHMTEIFHSSNLSESQTLMSDMERILNEIEDDDTYDDTLTYDDIINDNGNDLPNELHPTVVTTNSLQVNEEEMDAVLQSIEQNAELYT